MIRFISLIMLLPFFLSLTGCSKSEKSDPDADEWSDIQALADEVSVEAQQQDTPAEAGTADELDEFTGLAQRLQQMKSIERQPGQTLLTSEKLVFDYQQRFVRMDDNVQVEDDQGQLETQHLVGRFSVSNQVEHIEASGGVDIVSGDRNAHSDEAVYNYLSGFVQLSGQAVAMEGGNTLSAERIRYWTQGTRRLICEPNAVLVVSGDSAMAIDELTASGETELRASRMVYDESRNRADLTGQVKLRHEQIAMDCDEVHLFLKDNNKIDWIEAVSEVIIQSEDRKAVADRAEYYADEGKFLLEGSPKVMQENNVMTGDRIIFWHETRRMVCEPNARVLLYLDEETKAKFLKDLND